MAARSWTCQRQAAGVRCGTKNPGRRQICLGCGKKRGPLPKTAAQKALGRPYEEWIAHYGDRCEICGTAQVQGGRTLHRDHEHVTLLPRGILCFPCNVMLRNRVTPQWLRKAAYYLETAEERRKGFA